MSEFVRVGALVEIPEGELRAYDVPAGRVVVTHDEHRLFAVGETCTGSGCSLSEGAFDDRSERLPSRCSPFARWTAGWSCRRTR